VKTTILIVGLIFYCSNLYAQTCTPPNYCADQSTTVKPYPAGSVPTPPALNTSYVDPVFHRAIWRWTDGTISPDGQRAQGINWHSGDFAGVFNAMSNALVATGDDGWSTVLKLNLSNPSAPSVALWSCTDTTTGLCTRGQIKIGDDPIFANLSNYVLYYMTNLGVLSKADFTANYSSPSTAPTVTSPLFNPFAAGNCAAALTPLNGGSQPFITSDDNYIWGFEASTSDKIIIWKQGDANCTLLDMAATGGTWAVSGVGKQGGGTGTISFISESGGSASNPGTGCTLHSQWYDQVTNTVVAQIQGRDCSNYSGIDSFHISLTSLEGWACDPTHFCGSGHGLGFTLSVAGQGYETNFGTFSLNTLTLWSIPLTLPDTPEASGQYPPDQTGQNFINGHAATVWTTSFPVLGALYNQDNQQNTAPPQTTLPTTFSIPFAEEIDFWTIPDTTGLNTKYFRFCHTYEADSDYDSGGAYYSAVGPALAPNKCWVAFPSNWYGNLGTTGSRGTPCTISSHCAYDVFAVYLCNGTSGATVISPPTNLTATVQ
jgi:hypothetical protein